MNVYLLFVKENSSAHSNVDNNYLKFHEYLRKLIIEILHDEL